ncbi:cytochrome c2 [Jannaschia pagri]|uniref:Cytochrome c2 n=1 Tax=Jannaschia pagri TaxID=2829797 RepID=A0ABQ4NLB2_9RHOB|nr:MULTISPECIES: cytochrome C [unclassified Jannaschia]GIT91369.1 cytochrome c2 [Jannaschia sp. AI_61]GIT95203.1 cytochrome c2 [Jannaschia sp. AI_62]
MLRTFTLAAAAFAALSAAPALADGHAVDLTATGDVDAGERAFRQCQSCHVVQDPDGEVLAGRAAKTGPNLYGIVGRLSGAVEGFRYSDLTMAAGEAGMIYDEANFVAYVQDPTAHLQEVSGASGRSKMSYKVRKEEDAINLYAFLAQFSEIEGDS